MMALVLWLCLIGVASSFQGNIIYNLQSRVGSSRTNSFLPASSVLEGDLTQTLDPRSSVGEDSTDVFHDWFDSHPDSFRSPALAHAEFRGGLRGLSWTDDDDDDDNNNKEKEQVVVIAKVPGAVTLQANYADKDWDVQLALQLLNEQDKASSGHSGLEGYLALLPDQPAPNAIRHWTIEQRQRLLSNGSSSSETMAGQRLLERSDRQLEKWQTAYDSLTVTTPQAAISWDQFEWAMETVNSRALCGLSSTSGLLWRSAGAPLTAAAAAYVFLEAYSSLTSSSSGSSGGGGMEDAIPLVVLGGLAVAAVLPTILHIVRPTPELVYMLPLLDSANHRGRDGDGESTSIKWNPIRRHFALVLNRKLLREETIRDNKGSSNNNDEDPLAIQQVSFNYGEKSDAEWLLNFGFLPSVWGDDVTSDDERRRLAEAFVSRNQ